jgi:N-carbamoyl-L-amino-acid hydrolase
MDPRLSEFLRDACAKSELPVEMVPSGAGHDASLFANAGIPTAMLFVRNEHGSHNPDEAMELDDFMLGTKVLYEALEAIPRGRKS